VLNNFEGFQEKKRRKRLPPARMKQLPMFNIEDIVGNFDIDEEGNYMIISNGEDQRGNMILEDMDGLRVNRRGYLINNQGEVVLKDGTVIFRAEEVDEDGEIPAPFCYRKNGCEDKPEGNNMPDANSQQNETDEEMDVVDMEYRRLQQDGARSSDEDMDAAVAPSKQIKRQAPQQVLLAPTDEDFHAQASKPMRPMLKKELVLHHPPSTSNKKREQSGVGTVSIDQDFFINGNIIPDDNSNSMLN
jgi:hypothetical protein